MHRAGPGTGPPNRFAMPSPGALLSDPRVKRRHQQPKPASAPHSEVRPDCARQHFARAIKMNFSATGFETVGAFFTLAQHAYDEPMGGCTPPPLVPMVLHAQEHNSDFNRDTLASAVAAVMAMPVLSSYATTLDDLANVKMVPLAGLPVYVGLARNKRNLRAAYLGVLMLRILTSDREERSFAAVVATGVVTRLVEIVRLGTPSALDDPVPAKAELHRQLLWEAWWTLRNIPPQHAKHLVDAGAIPCFLEHMSHSTWEVTVNRPAPAKAALHLRILLEAAWCLSTMAVQHGQQLIDSGAQGYLATQMRYRLSDDIYMHCGLAIDCMADCMVNRCTPEDFS